MWAVIRRELAPAVLVTGASIDNQTSIQLHASVSSFDNILGHVWIA